MCILYVSLKVIFAGESFIAIGRRAGKRTLLGVAPHVSLEAAWSVEPLLTTWNGADKVPLSTGLAICSEGAIVCVVNFVVFRVV
jgi:hypothetical protein